MLLNEPCVCVCVMVGWFYGMSTFIELSIAEVSLIIMAFNYKWNISIILNSYTIYHLKQLDLTHSWNYNRYYHFTSE